MNERTTAGNTFGEIIVEVFRMNGSLIAAGNRIAAPEGQSSARWQVLGVVSGEPASVSQIARTMGLARQSVQRTADLLAADGLVRYTDNPHHRRAKLVTMTDEGHRTLDAIGERQALWANRIGEKQDPEQMRTAVAVLRQLRVTLEKDDNGMETSADSGGLCSQIDRFNDQRNSQ